MRLYKLVLYFIFTSSICYAQQLKKSNEEVIFSFTTLDNKTVTVAYEKQQNYVVVRYGTKEKLEFEVIESKTTGEKKLKYSFYKRGTIQHINYLDLNYLCLNLGSMQYVIFEDYISTHADPEIGIIITDANVGERKEIKGVSATRQGGMRDFKENELVEISTSVYR